ncbi:MAG: biopolymer transporter ExbD [Bacteroidetes bacterium GWE2_29_8]|nr:MAG: biopolymer transporter ExbD [Bacteroidetes bacterium GWE2_29_8]OFY20339.1 MAG: biopolymer transporter ExbD [Bacteroidetes bacterium GWF2_29_10]
MKIQRSNKFSAEVYTGSLNDIMFFLLLFFLIVSTLSNPNVIKLMLPKSSTPQTINKQQITLSVTSDKRYYINKDEVSFENLEDKLKNTFLNISEPTIILRADNTLSIQDLVDVLQIGNKLSVRMVLATNKISQK